MAKQQSKAEAAGAAVQVGAEVRYVDPAGPAETSAKVIGVRGDVVDLAYRDIDGRLQVAEGVRRGPGEINCWGRPGEVPKAHAIPMAGGKPITVGAAIRLHSSTTDTSFETFSLVDGNVVELLGPDEFVAFLPALATHRKVRTRDYCDRFRRGSWSWASDVVEVPPPRRYGLAYRQERCPVMTGAKFARGDGVRVVVGPPRGRRDGDEFLVSPAAAELVRKLLRGEKVELPVPAEPVA